MNISHIVGIGKKLARQSVLLSERRCLACTLPFMPPAEGRIQQPEGVGALLARWLCPTCSTGCERQNAGYCPHCGEAAAWSLLPPSPCGRCLETLPPWVNFIFYGRYEGILRDLLLRLKFANECTLGYLLGMLLGQHPLFENLSVDAIIPIPLHPRRLATRGYNQALELARPLLRRLATPTGKTVPLLLPQGILRVVHSKPQSGLTRAERFQNTRHIFQGSSSVAGKRILLVDDIFTTGATLITATHALLSAGAAAVSVAVMARTSERRLRS